MKLVLLAYIMVLCSNVSAQDPQGSDAKAATEAETEKEWAVMSHPGDLTKVSQCFKTVEVANSVKYQNEEYARELQRVRKMLAQKQETTTPQDLMGLRKVRSIKISRLGVFKYPYFTCKFRKKKEGLFFEKTSGSQRKSGLIFEDTPTKMIFLGGWSVNDDPQWSYSRLSGSKVTKHDSVGIFIKRGGRILALFPGGETDYELYEFSK